jgi:hypothetical protein
MPSQEEINSSSPSQFYAARNINKRAALRRCFEVTLAGGHEGSRKLSDVPQSPMVMARGGPVRMRQKQAVAKSRSIRERPRAAAAWPVPYLWS